MSKEFQINEWNSFPESRFEEEEIRPFKVLFLLKNIELQTLVIFVRVAYSNKMKCKIVRIACNFVNTVI